MKRIAILAAFGLAILSASAGAQQIARSPNGNEFLAACQHNDKACYWLILGEAESLNARNASTQEIPPIEFNACIPAIKVDDLVRNVIGVMLTSAKIAPELFQMSTAAPLITSTMAHLYPCKRDMAMPAK